MSRPRGPTSGRLADVETLLRWASSSTVPIERRSLVTIRDIARMSGWSYHRATYYLRTLDAKADGKILVDVSREGSRTRRYAVDVDRLREAAPHFASRDKEYQGLVDAEDLERLRARVKRLEGLVEKMLAEKRDDTSGEWITLSQIAALLDAPRTRVARIVTSLGLRGRNIPGLVRRETRITCGNAMHRYSREAFRLVEEALAEEDADACRVDASGDAP